MTDRDDYIRRRNQAKELRATPRGEYLFSKAMSIAAKKLKEEDPIESEEMESCLKGEFVFSPGGYIFSKALYLAALELRDKAPFEAKQMELLLADYDLYPLIKLEKEKVRRLAERYQGPFPFYTLLSEKILGRVSKDEKDGFAAETWDWIWGRWQTGFCVSSVWEGRKISQSQAERWFMRKRKIRSNEKKAN